jgi:apolipoprotein N-acyltransferase
MSLKTFHLVFISASSALAFGCGIWWLKDFVSNDSGFWGLISGLLALAVGLALIFYGSYFLKKLKRISYL